MLYGFVKIIARAAIKLYCRNLKINKEELLKCDGPILLASNHPNSFLDAIILCTIFDKPVYSLARGDAFNGKLITKLLLLFRMLPVYRVSEGVENLDENYKTFDACKAIFKQNGIVLIFCEGRCINEWRRRPLKKGTARLALSSWADGIPLKVLPVGINYNSFEIFGKNIRLFFGEFIVANDIDTKEGFGKAIHTFNEKLEAQLKPLVFDIDSSDKEKLHTTFYIPLSTLKKILLFLPSITGWVLHAPLFYPLKKSIYKKTKSSDHFDSVIIALLFFAYPLYVGLVTLMAFLWSGCWYAFLLLVVFPFTAWAHLQLKRQMD